MKKNIFTFLVLLFSFNSLISQESEEFSRASFESVNKATYSLGTGVVLNFDDSTHLFTIGGMVQPRFLNKQSDDSTIAPQNFFGAKRAYFNLSGILNNGLFSFLLQTNFTESYPLLDAWAGYHPSKNFSLFFGQRMSPCNNLSMQFMEYNLQFASRNNLSQVFNESGREFGMFIESKFSFGNFGVKPSLAITSGDGRNSFGESSSDTDKGGLKYGGRLNLYPLGFFSHGNELVGHDIIREQKPKILIGAASSFNTGSSHKVGEGHYLGLNIDGTSINSGTFTLYDTLGFNKFPNYLKNNIDFLFKYKGFNLLFEYVNTAGYNLQSTATNVGGSLLDTTQISEFLVLGSAYNIQCGYFFEGDWSIDLKYGQSFKEFIYNDNSILRNYDSMGLGLTKYFSNRAVKVQLMASYLNYYENVETNQLNFECLLQIRF